MTTEHEIPPKKELPWLGGCPRIRLLKRAVPNCILRNLKIFEAKFKIDQKQHIFDVRSSSWPTYPVYFYLYCRVCSEISKFWTD